MISSIIIYNAIPLLFIIFLFLKPNERLKIRKLLRPLKIRELFSLIGYQIRYKTLWFFRLIIFILILIWAVPVTLTNNSTNQNAATTNTNSTTTNNSNPNVSTIVKASNQMQQSGQSPSDDQWVPKTTTVTTKATYTNPDKIYTNSSPASTQSGNANQQVNTNMGNANNNSNISSNGSATIKLSPTTTYDVETSSQIDYLKLILNTKTLAILKTFLAVLFSVVSAFLVTMPFTRKVEQIKFFGFEYKILEEKAVQEVAKQYVTELRLAEQAKFSIIKSMLSIDGVNFSRKLWDHTNYNPSHHLFAFFETMLRLLQFQLSNVKIQIGTGIVGYSNGRPNREQIKKMDVTMRDVIQKAAEEGEAKWETADKTYIFAKAIFPNKQKQQDNFFVVLFHSRAISFDEQDIIFIDTIQDLIQEQQNMFVATSTQHSQTS